MTATPRHSHQHLTGAGDVGPHPQSHCQGLRTPIHCGDVLSSRRDLRPALRQRDVGRVPTRHVSPSGFPCRVLSAHHRDATEETRGDMGLPKVRGCVEGGGGADNPGVHPASMPHHSQADHRPTHPRRV